MKERLTSRKIGHLTLVLVILLSLVAYRTWFSGPQPVVVEAKNDQICDLTLTFCSTLIANKPLTASVAQLPVKAEHDFNLNLQGGDPTITPNKAWLEGKEMFMGSTPVIFEPHEGGWQGKAQVSACTSAAMVWLLNIEWSNGQRQQLALTVSR